MNIEIFDVIWAMTMLAISTYLRKEVGTIWTYWVIKIGVFAYIGSFILEFVGSFARFASEGHGIWADLGFLMQWGVGFTVLVWLIHHVIETLLKGDLTKWVVLIGTCGSVAIDLGVMIYDLW